MARQKKGKMYKKKLRVQKGQIIDEETISVTASVTNGGHSKEGMKGIIFGLSKEKRLLLEQNKLLRKKVEKLELERVARRGDENVQARTFSEHLKEKLFNCTEEGCGKAFALRKDLVKHISQVHLKERKYICEEDSCGKKFGNKSNLERHRRGVHLKERFIHCNDCKKNFPRKDQLDAHIKTVHQNIRPHCCKEGGCSKAFALKKDLVKHVRGVHLKERNYVCEEEGCGKVFCTKFNLERHLKAVHQEG